MQNKTLLSSMADLQGLIEEHEEIVAEMAARVSALTQEHSALLLEEKTIREDKGTFLSERVTSLRARQVRNASAMVHAVRVYRLNLDIEAGLVAEYDQAVREHDAAMVAMKSAKSAKTAKRRAICRNHEN